jgi:hypothetical protein
MNHPDSEVIRLNLVFDYPVRWSRFKVLRDLLQNFYDAVGHRQWRERFVWAWADDRLTFKVAGVGFSYDWLLHIGASTKREHPGEYAGYFGEGFKIAALCALRDHDWRIELASRDWRLQVTTAGIVVDGRALTSLAYRIWRGEPVRDETILWIDAFREGDREILECVLPSFYYEENPLFGEKLWSSSKAAVFLRSGQPKPAGYPATGECRGPGIVFAGYQALVTQIFPDLLGERPLPPCLIIKHDRAVWMGMAVCVPRINQARNLAGWVMRHELAYVALKPGLLRIGRGAEALSTYLHELAHGFGGDRSAAFGHALTRLLETALNHAVELTQFQQAWDRCCAVEQRLDPGPS